MRYNGNTIEKRTIEVTIPKTNVKLKVCGIPIGWEIDFAKLWPVPTARVRTVQKSGGRTESTPVNAAEVDTENEFRNNVKMAYRTYLALQMDTSVEFDNKPTDVDSLKALAKELACSGLESGDIIIILHASARISNLDDNAYNEALGDFA